MNEIATQTAQENELAMLNRLIKHQREVIRDLQAINADNIQTNRVYLKTMDTASLLIGRLSSDNPVGYLSQSLFPDGLHASTKGLVIMFAAAMGEKLYKAQLKYGFTNGWQDPSGWKTEKDGCVFTGEESCRQAFDEHVRKGDPLDVANYCAFMWHNGWSTSQGGQ